MKNEKKIARKLLSYLLAISLLFSVSIQEGHCKWDDKSDELPGMMSDGAVIALAAGAVVIIGLGTYLLVRSSKKKKAATSEFMKYSSPSGTVITINKTQTLYEQLQSAEKMVPCNVILDVGKPVYNFKSGGMSNVGVEVGLRFSF